MHCTKGLLYATFVALAINIWFVGFFLAKITVG